MGGNVHYLTRRWAGEFSYLLSRVRAPERLDSSLGAFGRGCRRRRRVLCLCVCVFVRSGGSRAGRPRPTHQGSLKVSFILRPTRCYPPATHPRPTAATHPPRPHSYRQRPGVSCIYIYIYIYNYIYTYYYIYYMCTYTLIRV